MFGRKKKQDVQIQISYKASDDKIKEYDEEAKKISALFKEWYPKHVLPEIDKKEYSERLDKAPQLEIHVAGVLVHTNGWLKEGFFTTSSDKKKEFVKSVIEATMSGKVPDVAEYKKELKRGRDHCEKVALDEANETSKILKAQRLEEEERRRVEKAEKLKAINEKKKAAEQQAAAAEANSPKSARKTADTPAKPRKEHAVAPGNASPKAKASAKSQAKPKAKAQESAATRSASSPRIDVEKITHEAEHLVKEEVPVKTDAETSVEDIVKTVETDGVTKDAMYIRIQDSLKLPQCDTEPLKSTPDADSAGATAVTAAEPLEETTPQAAAAPAPLEVAPVAQETVLANASPCAASAVVAPKQSQSLTAATSSAWPRRLEDLLPFLGFACCRTSIKEHDSVGDLPAAVMEDTALCA